MLSAVRRVGAGAVARGNARALSDAAREQMIIFDTTLRDGEQQLSLALTCARRFFTEVSCRCAQPC